MMAGFGKPGLPVVVVIALLVLLPAWFHYNGDAF